MDRAPAVVSRETIKGPEAQAAKKIEAASLLTGHPQYTALVEDLRKVAALLVDSLTSHVAPGSTPPPDQTQDDAAHHGNSCSRSLR